jgi:hypothetical protein
MDKDRSAKAAIARIMQNAQDRNAGALEEKRFDEVRKTSLDTQETILKSFKFLIDYLDHPERISKTVITNQLKEIGTPDALKVVKAVEELHSTLKTHENTDLSEVASLLKGVLHEARQIPKSQVQIPKEVTIANQIDLSSELKSLLDAVKAIRLVAEAPKVTLPAPIVNVDAPDLSPVDKGLKAVEKAVKSLEFPEYKTNNQEVEKLLKKTNKTLSSILDKPVSRGGSGGGRATPYEDANNIPFFPQVDSNGRIPVYQAQDFDYLDVQQTDADTETFVFKTGGSGGTAVRTITINYTSADKTAINEVIWT